MNIVIEMLKFVFILLYLFIAFNIAISSYNGVVKPDEDTIWIKLFLFPIALIISLFWGLVIVVQSIISKHVIEIHDMTELCNDAENINKKSGILEDGLYKTLKGNSKPKEYP